MVPELFFGVQMQGQTSGVQSEILVDVTEFERETGVEKTFFLFSGLPEIRVTHVSFSDFTLYPSTIFLDG